MDLLKSAAPAHRVVSHEEWFKAHQAHLAREKELTRLRDELAAQRRQLPWERVDKRFEFDTHEGKRTLAELFDGRSQLCVYHFMFGPDWPEGCPGCSFITDHIDGSAPHLAARDVTLTLVSRAPLAKIDAFKRRMGWTVPWVSSGGTDFNFDYRVTFTKEQVAAKGKGYNFGTLPPYAEENPGMSLFFRDEAGEVYHTFSTYARGLDAMLGAYVILDLAPKGRDEAGLPRPMAWLKHHDKYEHAQAAEAAAGACCKH
jgi:predicted dithiol-disulfide oxidoreductase (DUF899 family)